MENINYAKTESPLSEIRTSMNRQADTLKCIDENISQLYQRLSPILAQSIPMDSNKESPALNSELGKEISGNNNKLHSINSALQEMLSRIQL